MVEKTVKTLIKEVLEKYGVDSNCFEKEREIEATVLLTGFLTKYPKDKQAGLDNTTLNNIFRHVNNYYNYLDTNITDEEASQLSLPIKKWLNCDGSKSGLLFTKEELDNFLKEINEDPHLDSYDKKDYYKKTIGCYITDNMFANVPINILEQFIDELFLGHQELKERYLEYHDIYQSKINANYLKNPDEALETYSFLQPKDRWSIYLPGYIISEVSLNQYLKYKSLRALRRSFTLSSDNYLWNLPKKDPNYFMTAIYAAWALCEHHDKHRYNATKSPKYMVEKAGKYSAMVRMMNYDWDRISKLIVKDNPNIFSHDMEYYDYEEQLYK